MDFKIHAKRSQAAKLRKFADGGGIIGNTEPNKYLNPSNKGVQSQGSSDDDDIPAKYVGSRTGSDVEYRQSAARTGQDTENVGMKYPRGGDDNESDGLKTAAPRSDYEDNVMSQKTPTPMPKPRVSMSAKSKPSGPSLTARDKETMRIDSVRKANKSSRGDSTTGE